MASVLHFMSDRMERPACGAQVFLCDEYTDDVRYVDCGRCKRTKAFRDFDPTRYRVDVWNHEGDVVDSERSATADEVDAIRERYANDPGLSVVAEEI